MIVWADEDTNRVMCGRPTLLESRWNARTGLGAEYRFGEWNAFDAATDRRSRGSPRPLSVGVRQNPSASESPWMMAPTSESSPPGKATRL